MQYSKSITLYSICLLLSFVTLIGCSPYVYKKEITTLHNGVELANNTFKEYNSIYLASSQKKFLKKKVNSTDGVAQLTNGCQKLLDLFDQLEKAPLKKIDLTEHRKKCQLTPPTETYPVDINPNLSMISATLLDYSRALKAITNAEDKQALQAAFNETNANLISLVDTLKKEKLTDAEKTAMSSVAIVVYKVGAAILDQRRYDVLKSSVNDAQPVIEIAAHYLSIATSKIFLKLANEKLGQLEELENSLSEKQAEEYQLSWKKLNEARIEYIQIVNSNPNNVYSSLVAAHDSLVESINDPDNPDQLKAVVANAKDFFESAKSASESVKATLKDVGGT